MFLCEVRFAIVDCATEKAHLFKVFLPQNYRHSACGPSLAGAKHQTVQVLCNTEQVKMYPTIAQYKDDVCSQGAGRIGVEFLGSS